MEFAALVVIPAAVAAAPGEIAEVGFLEHVLAAIPAAVAQRPQPTNL